MTLPNNSIEGAAFTPIPGIDLDVVIIGAGISGINTAYYLETTSPAGLSYVILEARDNIGGTWDLFKYPGIRTDSDIHTFGFSWNPWQLTKPLASEPEILTYLQESAEKYDIDNKIRFNHRVLSADWSSQHSTWTVTIHVNKRDTVTICARYIVLGTGYYDYDKPMNAPIPGLSDFQGPIIQPQFWPDDVDYIDKNMVVIGSGATAVTIVPSVAERVSHVTMLQRSPTYILSRPQSNPQTPLIEKVLPNSLSNRFRRIRFMFFGYVRYYWCTFFPESAKEYIKKATIKQLPPSVSYDPHFKPRYNPWDQRLCACPDGDFFAAIRSGKASVVTDTIKTVTKKEIQLASGQCLHPDIIVMATGLKLRFAGGIKLSIDGVHIDPASRFMWRGCMVQDIPNLVFIFGYDNASWTLGAEVTATLFARLLHLMKSKKALTVIPRVEYPESMTEYQPLNLKSTYVSNGKKAWPKAGDGVWKRRSNYFLDIMDATWGDISNGLEFC